MTVVESVTRAWVPSVVIRSRGSISAIAASSFEQWYSDGRYVYVQGTTRGEGVNLRGDEDQPAKEKKHKRDMWMCYGVCPLLSRAPAQTYGVLPHRLHPIGGK